MVPELKCRCCEHTDESIDTVKKFRKIEQYFDQQVDMHIFKELCPSIPYYTWKSGHSEKRWYATKWYHCTCCGCLWEVKYPDFPSKGFVRKFPDGEYRERGY